MIATSSAGEVAKCATGIQGMDAVIGGGLPARGLTRGRGNSGAGTSTLSMEFLVQGAREFDEQGLYFSFEERTQELLTHFASMGWALPQLVESDAIRLDEVGSDRADFRTCRKPGCFDLDALLSRLEHAMNVADAERVVLDGALEFMLPEYEDACTAGQEVGRFIRRMKDTNATVLLTCGRETDEASDLAVAERLSDCVLALYKQNSPPGISDRTLEVRKYRGGSHGDRFYPFTITSDGLSVLPTGSISLEYGVGDERISTGVPGLDAMLGHAGFYRGAGVLVTGAAGTGKTTLGSGFVESACRRGERALYFSFEEPPGEITRNMQCLGLELQTWVNHGKLRLEARRPAEQGPGGHILDILREVESFRPQVVVIDPLPSRKEMAPAPGKPC
ncbi:MAG: ATPase domain-containing protein [Planctomycetota bacterium]